MPTQRLPAELTSHQLEKLQKDSAKSPAASSTSADPAEKVARDRDNRKAIIFSYFADTIYYLQDNIDLILGSRPELAPYKDRVAFVTGSSRKRR